MKHPFIRLCFLAISALAMLPLSGRAQPASEALKGVVEKRPETLAAALENLGRVYHNKENPVLQELWLLGRYHGQQHWSDSSSGRYEESWESRRFRIGAQAKLFNKLTLHAQMVSGTDMEPFYGGFSELWAQWSFHEALNLTVGQQKNRFTHDRTVSSRYLNYLERALLTNMFGIDYTPAVTLGGKFGRFSYYTGIFSNATGTDMGRAFTELNSGFTGLASVTYDLGKMVPTDTAFLNVSYVYSEATAKATNFNRFEHGISTALILTEGPVSLVTEITSGLGGRRGDAHGINFQPSLFLTDTIQIVGRYQLATSDQPAGLTAQRRYERNVGLTTGNLYQAAYAGVNYYIAGHRLKLLSGVEYATLGGRDSWTVMAAVRLFWGPHSKGPFPMAQTLDGAF